MTANDDGRPSATTSVLLALVPFTEPNLRLSFNPTRFFDELERGSGYPRTTLQQSYARLKSRGLVTNDKVPQLTAKGRRAVQPYVATRLGGNAQLMVIFDIPEDFGEQRRQLRTLLRQLGFQQTQRSVWMSSMDHTAVLRDMIDELTLGEWVELYEVVRLK